MANSGTFKSIRFLRPSEVKEGMYVTPVNAREGKMHYPTSFCGMVSRVRAFTYPVLFLTNDIKNHACGFSETSFDWRKYQFKRIPKRVVAQLKGQI